MSKGGMGSALIILIFTVLCLAIFSAISYISAHNSRTLMESEVSMVKAFYEADTKAEMILAQLLANQEVTHDVNLQWWYEFGHFVSFEVPVTETRLLSVIVSIPPENPRDYTILSWQMMDNREWTPDFRLPVWEGGFDDEFEIDEEFDLD